VNDRNGGMEMIGQLGHTEGVNKQLADSLEPAGHRVLIHMVQTSKRKPAVRIDREQSRNIDIIRQTWKKA
jgi:hypothetical protein